MRITPVQTRAGKDPPPAFEIAEALEGNRSPCPEALALSQPMDRRQIAPRPRMVDPGPGQPRRVRACPEREGVPPTGGSPFPPAVRSTIRRAAFAPTNRDKRLVGVFSRIFIALAEAGTSGTSRDKAPCPTAPGQGGTYRDKMRCPGHCTTHTRSSRTTISRAVSSSSLHRLKARLRVSRFSEEESSPSVMQASRHRSKLTPAWLGYCGLR